MPYTIRVRNAVFESQTCSVARALEIIGEWWTLLIVREAFFGTKRFSDFERMLGVAKNVLSDRLAKLVAAGVMERSPVTGRGNPRDYTLTQKGLDLFPAVMALMQWGDRWINSPEHAPVRVLERETGAEISQVQVRSAEDKVLSLADVVVVPGPGANEAIRRRFGRSRKGEKKPPESELQENFLFSHACQRFPKEVTRIAVREIRVGREQFRSASPSNVKDSEHLMPLQKLVWLFPSKASTAICGS